MDLDNLIPTLHGHGDLDVMYDGMKESYQSCNDILDHLEDNALMDQQIPDEQSLNEAHWLDDINRADLVNNTLPQPEKEIEDRIIEELVDHKSRLLDIIAEYKSNLGYIYNSNVQDHGNVPDMAVLPEMNDPTSIDRNFSTIAASPDSFYSSFVSDQTVSGYASKECQDIEQDINTEHIKLVSLCLKLCRQLDV